MHKCYGSKQELNQDGRTEHELQLNPFYKAIEMMCVCMCVYKIYIINTLYILL